MTRSNATPIVSTTPTIEGTPIRRYLGVVIGQAILGAESTNDVLADLRNGVGSRMTGYQRELAEARALALDEMTGAAVDLGGDGVVGVDLDYETVGANASMLMITASGTAVQFFVD
jgi:uncharacterized protein YbjQ (UPF0145 family)